MRAVILIAALAAGPAGCTGQEPREDVQVRVDSTPIEQKSLNTVSSYAEVLRDVSPTVVSVFSRRIIDDSDLAGHPLLDRFFGSRSHRSGSNRLESGLGSGVIISSQGYVLTNNHVVDGADEVAVRLEDGRELIAEIIGADPRTDVAVLRIKNDGPLPSAVMADSDHVAVGDVVFALGNALGIGHAVTTGIISARGRTGIGILGEEGYEDFLQTDASMNVGNSGGPLVDAQGRVIGINTAIASPGGGNVGIGFAIPINMARSVMENLIRFGEVPRGYLGITLQDLTRELAEEFGVARGGVLVVNVMTESPAAGAGLRQGDVVVGLDGEAVESAGVLRLRVGQMPPETEVRLSVLRDGQQVDLPVVLGRQQPEEHQEERQAELARDELLEGIAVREMDSDLRRKYDLGETIQGLVVTEVNPLSPFAEVFSVGAVVLQINRQYVQEVGEARDQIREGRNLFLLLVDGAFQYVTVEVQSS